MDLFWTAAGRVDPAGRRSGGARHSSSAERATGLAREAARGESQKLAVGISPETDWLFLGKALRLFAEHAPSVYVIFQNLTPEAQVDALRGGDIDVGFVGLPLEAEGMVTEMTGRVRLVVALPEKHPMARKNDLRLEELSKEAYVLWPRHLSPGSYDQLLSVFRRAGFGEPIAMEGGLPSTRTILGMIAAGLTMPFVDPVLNRWPRRSHLPSARGLRGLTETGAPIGGDPPDPRFLLQEGGRPRESPCSSRSKREKKKGAPREAAQPPEGARGRVAAGP